MSSCTRVGGSVTARSRSHLRVLAIPWTFLPAFLLCAAVTGGEGEDALCTKLGDKELCCGGRVYKRNLDRTCCNFKNDKVYVPRLQCRDGQTQTQFERCGTDERFDYRYQDCCAGWQTFDRQTQECCAGSRNVTVVARGIPCCNGLPLVERELCCNVMNNLIAVAKEHESHTKCCYIAQTNRIHTYNPSEMYCNEDKMEMHTLPPGEKLLKVPQSPQAINDSVVKFPPINILSRTCLVGGEQTEEGEQLECCGSKTPYNPSGQTCCLGLLSNISSSTSVCCGDHAYDEKDRTNPCLKLCGGKLFNTEIQACCAQKIYVLTSGSEKCCGKYLIDPEQKHCCGDIPVLKSKLSCCEDRIPFYPNLLGCDKTSGTLKLRERLIRGQKLSEKFCTKSFNHWGQDWRSPVFPMLVHIQGRVDSCSIRFTKHTVIIPLAPAIVHRGGHSVSHCVGRGGLKLVLHLPDHLNCTSRKDAKSYLRKKTLDIFVEVDKLNCMEGSRPRLNLQNGDLALIFVSRRMDRVFTAELLNEGM